MSAPDLWTLFTGKAEAVGARVVRVASQREAAGLLGATDGQVAATASATEYFPAAVAGLTSIDHQVTNGGGGRAANVVEREAANIEGQVTNVGGGRTANVIGGPAANVVDGHAAHVVAVGVFAVAETGSVGLNEPRLDRGACFLADHLWLLLAAAEIVPSLDVALQRLQELVQQGAHHPLLMTGPSRTADIERILTIGVHGPRELTLVILDDT